MAEDDYEESAEDRADRSYALLKDEGRRHERWPEHYDANDRPVHDREIFQPSDRARRK